MLSRNPEPAHRQGRKISLLTGRNPEEDQALLLMACLGESTDTQVMHAHNCLMLKVAGLKLGRSVVLIGRSGHGGFNRVVFCIKAAYQRVAVRPAEIILNGFVIQARPLVLFIVAWWGQKRRPQYVFHASERSSGTWTHC